MHEIYTDKQERARRRAEERERAQAEQRALMLAANQQQQRLKVHLMAAQINHAACMTMRYWTVGLIS